jgi:hypothetical protein
MGFLVWMLVFDANDLGKQSISTTKWKELRNAEAPYYLDTHEVVKRDAAEPHELAARGWRSLLASGI